MSETETIGEVASMECDQWSATELGHSAPRRGRGRPRTRPDIEATPVSGKPGQLTVATIPYRVLARIRKMGPMTYSEISAFVAGSRMVRRDKYIDGAILRLRRSGYIELSKRDGFRGKWSVTAPGRSALIHAKPSVDQVMRRKQLKRAKYERQHHEHVERQRRMGIPEAMIQAPFDATFGATVPVG